MTFRKLLLPLSGMAMLAAASVSGAAPVRVVIFNTCAGYIHSISQQTPIIKKMLLDPAGSNLQNPVIPRDGFTVDSLGSATVAGTTADGHALVQALAQNKYDVVVCLNNTRFTQLFTTTDQKAFMDWAQAKGHGVVAIHGATDDPNTTWPEKITFFGGKFTTHRTEAAAVLADTTPSNATNPHFKALNAGLAKSYTIKDEWYSFQSQPRNLPGIQILSTLNEATFAPTDKMGDHPISWYRAPAGGGRMYYTGAGHDWIFFRDTYWLRRQVYNGILWASGYEDGVKIDHQAPSHPTQADIYSEASASLTVEIARDGAHAIEIRQLDGKRVAFQKGNGRVQHSFTGLRRETVYAVSVSMPEGRSSRLVRTR
jgi:type 1 glutamine amidotransferase